MAATLRMNVGETPAASDGGRAEVMETPLRHTVTHVI